MKHYPFRPPVYYCRRVHTPLVLDGRLNKPFWADIPFTEPFVDIEGPECGKTPRFPTRAKAAWDDDALYLAAEITGNEIWAGVTERDDVIFRDNDFEVFLAPEDCGHRYYELEMNALNTVWDLYMERPQRDLVRRVIAWDIRGLESAVKICGELNNPAADNRFWSLELKLPWFSFRECPKDCVKPPRMAPLPGEIWRMDFSRVEYDVDVVDGKYEKRKGPDGKPLPEHNWLWAPTGVIDAHMPEMWGYLIFTENGEDYPLPAADEVKLVLRRLYYREHIQSCKTGSFTADAVSLLGDEAERYNVKAYATPSLFEGTAEWRGVLWHIDQDGYLWEGEER